MIHDIEIHTMDDLFRMVSEQEYREDLGRFRSRNTGKIWAATGTCSSTAVSRMLLLRSLRA